MSDAGGADGTAAAEERLARLVHDLRTPLTVISGFCELLVRRRDELSPEQQADFIERISAAAVELREILDRERSERLGG